MTDFFTKKPETAKKAAGSRTVPGSKPKAKPPARKLVESGGEDEDEDSDIPPPPPRRPVARAVKKYVEIPSDEGETEGDSMYQDD